MECELSPEEADNLLESIISNCPDRKEMIARLRSLVLTPEQAIALDVAASTYVSGLRIVKRPKEFSEAENLTKLIGQLRPLITERFKEILMPNL
ncbi:hypothetical protein JW758_05665 [Candidatus Peregrinibacteria bacterium]|nr:hypothetical protein [Candidatus Peregrinibacteria bacterium]